MAYIKFKNWKPGDAALQVVAWCQDITTSYLARGYRLTLRQLYYQLVSPPWIPNELRWYKKLGNIVSRARLAGLIDWDTIEDRGRIVKAPPEWNNLSEAMTALIDQFRLNRWYNQPYYLEVWCEKNALSGVLEPAAKTRHHIRYMANLGYSSQTAMFDAAQKRFIAAYDRGQTPICLYLGDHDPSGNDMLRDIRDRLKLFGIKMPVHRLALNLDQVHQYNPPPNPAKVTDSRFKAYIEEFGRDSWELDALDPDVLTGLVDDAVERYINTTLYDAVIDREDELKEALRSAHTLAMEVADDEVSLPRWMVNQDFDLRPDRDGYTDLDRPEPENDEDED